MYVLSSYMSHNLKAWQPDILKRHTVRNYVDFSSNAELGEMFAQLIKRNFL